MNKKTLFAALSAVVLVSASYIGYRQVSNSSADDLFTANVEALSRSEISYGYKKHVSSCPRPQEFKQQVSCTKYGDDPNCLPSDC